MPPGVFTAFTSYKLAQVPLSEPQIGQVPRQVPGGGSPGSKTHLIGVLPILSPTSAPPAALADMAQAAKRATTIKAIIATKRLTFFFKIISQKIIFRL